MGSQDEEDEEDGDIDQTDDMDHNITINLEPAGELMSAIDSAYNSIYSTVAQDLGIPDDDDSVSTDLVVNRATHDAMNGSGPHQEWVEGIDEEVLGGMAGRVQANIRTFEVILRDTQHNGQRVEDEAQREESSEIEILASQNLWGVPAIQFVYARAICERR